MNGPILIWGAGAIGGTLAASFSHSGEPVVLVDQADDHVAQIRGDGLRIAGPILETVCRLPAFQPDELDGRFDRAFLCVKAHHTEAALEALLPHLTEDGAIVSAQNGLNERLIAAAAGPARTIGCFVNFGADYLEPGLIHYSGRGAVVIGELDGARSARVAALFELLRRFEPRAVLTDNIWGYLWGKLIYGGLLFATALTEDSIADALDSPANRPILARLGREIGAVASASGIRLEGFDGFDPVAFTPEAPAERTARSFADMVAHNRRSLKSHSGIWRDLAIRKRRTEVDAQLGPVVQTGAEVGVATPLTARLIGMIHEIEDGARPIARANLAELAR